MSFTTTPYATPEQVYNALNLSAAAQAKDASWIASDLLPQAQERIDDYVGYPFQTDGSVGTPATRVYSGNENPTLLIDHLVSLSSVLEVNQGMDINYGTQGAFAGLTLQKLDITSDIILGPDNEIPSWTLRRASQLPFYFGNGNYTVTGVFGHAAVPATITRACVRLVVHWYKMRDFNYTSLSGNAQYGYQKFDMSDLPPDVCKMLDKYQLKMFLAW